MQTLSIVGKDYQTEEEVRGYYTTGDRMKAWGKTGAFWGGFWGLFFGGAFIATPVLGPVIVLGYLTAAAISAIEGVVVFGGLSVLGAALYSIGIPKDSIIEYETALKADGFLVMVHGTTEDMARAKAVLARVVPMRLDEHEGVKAVEPKGLDPVGALFVTAR